MLTAVAVHTHIRTITLMAIDLRLDFLCFWLASSGHGAVPLYPFTSPPSTLSFSIFLLFPFSLSYSLHLFFFAFYPFPFYQDSLSLFPGQMSLEATKRLFVC